MWQAAGEGHSCRQHCAVGLLMYTCRALNALQHAVHGASSCKHAEHKTPRPSVAASLLQWWSQQQRLRPSKHLLLAELVI